MKKFSSIMTVIFLVVSLIVVLLISIFERSLVFKTVDLLRGNIWLTGAAGLVFLVLLLTGIITAISRKEGTLFSNGWFQLAILELLLCTAGLVYYRHYLQQPGRIVMRLVPDSTTESVRLLIRPGISGRSSADTVSAPGTLNGLSGGAYTFESIDPEILPFQTGLTLRPAATETLVVKAMLDTRRLSVNSEPSGAGIWINGLQGSKTPGTFDVLAGDTVRLELRMPDYQTYVDTLILTSDTDLGIVALRKLYTLRIAPQYDYTGYLVYDEEGVMVFSGSGVRRLELPEGKYRVAYEIGEGQYRTKRVSLGYNQTVTIP